MASPTILIPIEFPDPDPLPPTFVEGLTSCKVVLLGVYDLPDDVDDDERHRREIEAYQSLYTLASSFVRRGETAEVDLVMGEDASSAPTTVAEKRDVDAVLVPNPITTLGHVLVAIRDEKFAEPAAELLSSLDEEVLLHVSLLHVAETEADVEAGEDLLSRVKRRLVDEGFSQVSIDTEVVVSDDPAFAIAQAGRDDDLVIMGETQQPNVERVFGKTYDTVADRLERPILVVRED